MKAISKGYDQLEQFQLQRKIFYFEVTGVSKRTFLDVGLEALSPLDRELSLSELPD